MSSIRVSLLGKLNITLGTKNTNIRAHKVQELFIYLLIFRKKPQPRESLSEILWADQPVLASKKNLRQTLWHLQSAFREFKSSSRLELLIDDGWIDIKLPTDFWLDTAEFEGVFNQVNQKKIRELSPEDFAAMQYAVDLYGGDLLEGWYQDWCIFERERFQMMNLTLLDKLVQYCEMHQKYETGLAYGWRILHHDHAYERAHRQLMRLYALSGDRTQALHQYRRCIDSLRTELGVEPSNRTKHLYSQIQSDTFLSPLSTAEETVLLSEQVMPTYAEMLDRLEQFSRTLKAMETHVQQEIAALKVMLADQDKRSST